MSRAAYERVRKALEGTPLEGEIEKLCAELHLTPESPEWTIAALSIIGSQPLSTQMVITKARLEGALQDLPDALRAAGAEIVRGLGADIASQSLAAIRTGMASDLTDKIFPALQLVADDHRTEMQKTANALEERATSFGNGAQAAVDKLATAANEVRDHVNHHARALRTSLIARFAWVVGVTFFASAVTLAGSRFVFHQQCSTNVAHVRSYHSPAQLRTMQWEYCP